jgi:transglutaminase-like putative cysteine protease
LREAALELCRRVQASLRYQQAAPVDAVGVLKRGHGQCQDFAHLAIGGLRALGLAARYVGGYLLPASPRALRPLGAPGADAAAPIDPHRNPSHAWLAVALTDGSWLELDPSLAAGTSARHVTVAWGRDRDDVAPVRCRRAAFGPHRLRSRVVLEALG